jgi:hypothetical protein
MTNNTAEAILGIASSNYMGDEFPQWLADELGKLDLEHLEQMAKLWLLRDEILAAVKIVAMVNTPTWKMMERIEALEDNDE